MLSKMLLVYGVLLRTNAAAQESNGAPECVKGCAEKCYGENAMDSPDLCQCFKGCSTDRCDDPTRDFIEKFLDSGCQLEAAEDHCITCAEKFKNAGGCRRDGTLDGTKIPAGCDSCSEVAAKVCASHVNPNVELYPCPNPDATCQCRKEKTAQGHCGGPQTGGCWRNHDGRANCESHHDIWIGLENSEFCSKNDLHECERANGSLDLVTCVCSISPNCSLEDRHECEIRGGKFHDATCECEQPHQNTVCDNGFVIDYDTKVVGDWGHPRTCKSVFEDEGGWVSNPTTDDQVAGQQYYKDHCCAQSTGLVERVQRLSADGRMRMLISLFMDPKGSGIVEYYLNHLQDDKCSCESRSHCHSVGGMFDEDNCECHHHHCPPEARRHCHSVGGTFDEVTCECHHHHHCPPEARRHCHSVDGTFDEATCECHHHHHCPPEVQRHCEDIGGQFDNARCDCLPRPGCDPEAQWRCEEQGGLFDFGNCHCWPGAPIDRSCATNFACLDGWVPRDEDCHVDPATGEVHCDQEQCCQDALEAHCQSEEAQQCSHCATFAPCTRSIDPHCIKQEALDCLPCAETSMCATCAPGFDKNCFSHESFKGSGCDPSQLEYSIPQRRDGSCYVNPPFASDGYQRVEISSSTYSHSGGCTDATCSECTDSSSGDFTSEDVENLFQCREEEDGERSSRERGLLDIGAESIKCESGEPCGPANCEPGIDKKCVAFVVFSETSTCEVTDIADHATKGDYHAYAIADNTCRLDGSGRSYYKIDVHTSSSVWKGTGLVGCEDAACTEGCTELSMERGVCSSPDWANGLQLVALGYTEDFSDDTGVDSGPNTTPKEMFARSRAGRRWP